MLEPRRWGALYLALLLAAVGSPFTVSCASLPWLPELSRADFVLNVVLFLPLAALLPRPRILPAVLLGLAVSLAIELAQRFLFRSPNPWDLVANAGGAGVGALILRVLGPRLDTWGRAAVARVRPSWRALAGLALLLAATVAAEVVVRRAAAQPVPSFDTWAPMPLVIGCEQDTKPSFAGLVRGIEVYDRALSAPPAHVGAHGTYAEGGPVLTLDFTRGEARTDGVRSSTVALAPPPGVRMGPEGLWLEGGCWWLDDALADHVLERLRPRHAMSLVFELGLPAAPERGRARLFALTRLHSTWDFSVGHQGEELLMWYRSGAFEDAYEDPLGETGLLPVVPGQVGTAAFVLDDAKLRGLWDGTCRRERLVPMLGRPFLLGRGLGFTLAVLAVLAALGAAGLAPSRARAFAAIAGGAAMIGALYLRGAPAPLLGVQFNLLPAAALAVLAAAWAVRARGASR